MSVTLWKAHEPFLSHLGALPGPWWHLHSIYLIILYRPVISLLLAPHCKLLRVLFFVVCSVTGTVPRDEINTQSKFLQNKILFYELITVSIFHTGDLQSLTYINKMLEALHKKILFSLKKKNNLPPMEGHWGQKGLLSIGSFWNMLNCK